MKEQWETLAVLSEEIRDLYGIIVKLGAQKREALIVANAPELDKVTKQEELLITRIGKLQVNREAIIKKLAEANHLTEDSTFSEFLSFGPQDVTQRLEKANTELAEEVQELVALNRVNAEMLQKALAFIDYNMNLLSGSMANPTYAQTGQSSLTSLGRSFLDRKV
ncbi:MAG: flagellar protein FlgN [Negativicutes bacterium]|nr:flagellar protein FlgN [Negativicutes bacterium]